MGRFQIQRGDIFYVEKFGNPIGSEQRPGRPAVIVSCEENNRHSETIEVVYTTTQEKKGLPTHVLVQSTPRESTVLCEQVTTISVERLGNYIGRCTKEEMLRIDVALMTSLGLKVPNLKAELSAYQEKLIAPVPATPSVRQTTEGETRRTGKPTRRELNALKVERDTYREMYEQLLDRLLPVNGLTN